MAALKVWNPVTSQWEIVAGGSTLPDAGDEGDVLTNVDGFWTAAPVTLPPIVPGLTRTSDSYTSGSLAPNAVATGTLSLGKTYVPYKVTTTGTCRLRLYLSAAARTADAGRSETAVPVGNHGCVLDVIIDVTDTSTLVVIPNFTVFTDAGTTYFSLTNLANATAATTVTVHVGKLEA